MQHRAEEEAARQKQEKERAMAERKAWAQAKLEQRQERIIRAADERRKRDIAYCKLLETTRECAPRDPLQMVGATTVPFSNAATMLECTHTGVCARPLVEDSHVPLAA